MESRGRSDRDWSSPKFKKKKVFETAIVEVKPEATEACQERSNGNPMQVEETRESSVQWLDVRECIMAH